MHFWWHVPLWKDVTESSSKIWSSAPWLVVLSCFGRLLWPVALAGCFGRLSWYTCMCESSAYTLTGHQYYFSDYHGIMLTRIDTASSFIMVRQCDWTVDGVQWNCTWRMTSWYGCDWEASNHARHDIIQRACNRDKSPWSVYGMVYITLQSI